MNQVKTALLKIPKNSAVLNFCRAGSKLRFDPSLNNGSNTNSLINQLNILPRVGIMHQQSRFKKVFTIKDKNPVKI